MANGIANKTSICHDVTSLSVIVYIELWQMANKVEKLLCIEN
jgi:hypothetical protein